MAKKEKRESDLKKSRKREVLGILIICFSLFVLLALFTHSESDWPGSSRTFGEPTNNLTGQYGALIAHYIFEILGLTGYALVILLLTTGVISFLHKSLKYLVKPTILLIALGIFIPILISLSFDIGSQVTIPDADTSYGGVLGVFLVYSLVTYLGRVGTYLLSFAVILLSVVIATNLKPSTMVEYVIKYIRLIIRTTSAQIHKSGTRRKKYKKAGKQFPDTPEIYTKSEDNKAENPFLTAVEEELPAEQTPLKGVPPIQYHETPDFVTSEKDSYMTNNGDQGTHNDSEEKFGEAPARASKEENSLIPQKEYISPSADLLDEVVQDQLSESREEMIEKAHALVKNLGHFNIESEVLQITPGPIVTRYELTLAPGVKVGRVVNLSNDLAMALEAKGGIRILAPIPGKAAIGIEVPNKKRSIVYFREVIESEAFLTTDKPLVLALGKNTAGEPVIADLAKMPHLLIAGSTGSGKSVCIHTIMASILMKAPPDKVRILLVDPKVVELSVYNLIPHLLTPVVSDPTRASDALKWAVREMESRYRQLASLGVRDITQYNTKIDAMTYQADEEEQTEKLQPLPFIVVIIDEFADLMLVSSNEIEESIARLAQMARAVGIHLVLATQRPSADVITGLIKANFPSRIAFKVMQSSNSRIILDQNGADHLLGMGDMLFLQVGKPELIRLHGAFISNEECIRLVNFVSSQKVQRVDKITDEMFHEKPEEDDNRLGLRDPNARDSLFFKAARLVVRNDQGSVSLLQRRLKIGYARAARLIDQLELAGIVSPYDGSKARDVLVDDIYIDELEAGEI